MSYEDGYTYDAYEAEQERLHRLNKRRKLEEELADYEYEEMEDDLEWLHCIN